MEAKAIPIAEVASRLGIERLRRNGAELSGPCPLCGGHDRFNINTRTHAHLCRRCGIKGGDSLALVMSVLQLGFREALTWLCGDAPASIPPEELARRRRKAEQAERARQDASERYRRKAIADARSIWHRASADDLGMVRAYLGRRGISAEMIPELPRALRFLPDHPCVKKVGRELVTLHRGPCMIAGVLSREGQLAAVHQTWIDLSHPKGKAVIPVPGDDPISKLVRGSKKGGVILLSPRGESDTLVMGEGIETTLSAWAAQPVPGAVYWAGVDLGNMAGKAARVEGERWHGRPDMTDTEAFVPPGWVRRLIYLQDGDSEPRSTRHKLLCGLRRAMALRPGLKAQIVHAGEGVDFNDVLRGGDDEAEAQS